MTSSRNKDGSLSYAQYIYRNSPNQSKSSYTTIIFPVVPTDLYGAIGYDVKGASLYAVPDGGQIDFQVEALAGHNSTYWYSMHLLPEYGGFYESAIEYDIASVWSNTQTITIGEDSNSPEITTCTLPPNSTPTPNNSTPNTLLTNNTQLTTIAVIIAVFVAVIVSLLLYIKRLKSR